VTETLTRVEGTKTVEYQTQWVHYWLPESLAVTGNQDVESRRIGIYEGQIWHNDLSVKAHFDPSRIKALRKQTITLGSRFWWSASAMRAVLAIKSPEVNGETLSVEPGRVSTIAGRAFICRCRVTP
jgi:inner membrane protein